MTAQPTPNAISDLYHGHHDSARSIVVQVLGIKRMASNAAASSAAPSSDRYRLIISDGTHFLQAMVATQLNELVNSNAICKDALIRLNKVIMNTIQNRRIAIILDAEFVAHAGGKIGDPVNVDGQQPPQRPQTVSQPQPQHSFQQSIPSANQNVATYAQQQQHDQQEESNVFPIKSLNPYMNKWTIKARVISKSDIRHWSNQRGGGKLFSVTLLDDSGEIKATAFNDQVDQFFPTIQENRVYYFSGAAVKMAKKQYSNVNNDYELSFDHNTQIVECTGSSNLPQVRFDFVEIARLTEIEKDATVDVIGIVKEVGDLQSITAKVSQKQITKRDLVLVDQSNVAVRLTLWGSQAETFNGDGFPVLAVKGAKVSDYNGRSLSASGSSFMSINPDIEQSHFLRGWFDTTGHATATTNISAQSSGKTISGNDSRKTLAEVKGQNLGSGEKPDYFSVKATVVYIKSDNNLWYTACPTEGCNKKVTAEAPNSFRCEKCQRSFSYCDYRYVLSINVVDDTSSAWLQGFNDVGHQILGHKAEELNQMKEMDNQPAYQAVFQEANFKTYNFRVRAKQEFYNDENKIRLSIMSVEPVDYAKESKRLLDEISAY